MQLIVFAVELLIVAGLVGVVDALTAYKIPIAFVWWVKLVHVVLLVMRYPKLIKFSAHYGARRLKGLKGFAKVNDFVATGRGGVTVCGGEGPRICPCSLAGMIDGCADETSH